MGTQVWNEKYQAIEIVHMNGTKKLNGTLDNSAVSDNGDGTVDIAITGHGIAAGAKVRISGTTNYDGAHIITAVAANAITIEADYVAETPAGTETYAVAVEPPNVDFQLVETRLVLGGAAAAENFVVKLDADAGATYDCTLKTEAMNGLTQDIEVWMTGDQHRFFEAGDVIFFEFANTADDAWTLTTIYRRKA